MVSNTSSSGSTRIALGLIALGVIARLLPHPPNVSPVAALALFGAATLPRRWALLLPLGTLIISDVVLGWHEVVAFTWSGMMLAGCLGLWVRSQRRPVCIVAASLLSSASFFLLTNFGVWLLGAHGAAYPKTAEGLWLCYLAGLPFFRASLIGDLIYTAGIFGAYAWASGRATHTVSLPRPAS